MVLEISVQIQIKNRVLNPDFQGIIWNICATQSSYSHLIWLQTKLNFVNSIIWFELVSLLISSDSNACFLVVVIYSETKLANGATFESPALLNFELTFLLLVAQLILKV